MKTLANNWNLFRVIRLLLGIAVFIKGATDGEVVIALAGGLIALMSLANIGCCGRSGCAVPTSSQRADRTKQNDITYEEVDRTK